MTPRSKYDYKVIAGILCVVDADEEGARSVTNDAEQVVAELHALGLLPPGRRLIYRDSTGAWDEMVVREGGLFVGFAPLRAKSLLEALQVVQKQEADRGKH
jgi:hypothetical protein